MLHITVHLFTCVVPRYMCVCVCVCLQVLLAVYFFLVGMLVRGHPYMWILPTVSSLCAVLSSLVHVGSLLLVPVYRNLSLEKQAW